MKQPVRFPVGLFRNKLTGAEMTLRSLNQICHELKRTVVVRTVANLLSHRQCCFLVGGAVRDMFLGKPCSDFDFITPFDPCLLARNLSLELRGHWFMLDEQRRHSRVVVPGRDTELHCDFAPFRASSLTGDLSLRDFRVNAMTWRVHKDLGSEDFHDPLSGREDLRHRRLTMCSDEVLRNDPLRILKGIRHCKTLHLVPDERTVCAMRQAAHLLPAVAAERLRKEMGLLLDDPSPERALRLLFHCGAAEFVLGGWITSLDPEELFSRLSRCSRRMKECSDGEQKTRARKFLKEEFEEGVTRQAILNLATVLRGRPDMAVEKVSAGLKLSRAAGRALHAYTNLSATRFSELSELRCGPRGRYWWVSSLGFDPVGCLLFMACQSGPEISERILSLATEYVTSGPQRDLVDGGWLRRHLGIEAGPQVGEILRMLRSEEIAGRIRSAGQARELLQARYEKTD